MDEHYTDPDYRLDRSADYIDQDLTDRVEGRARTPKDWGMGSRGCGGGSELRDAGSEIDGDRREG